MDVNYGDKPIVRFVRRPGPSSRRDLLFPDSFTFIYGQIRYNKPLGAGDDPAPLCEDYWMGNKLKTRKSVSKRFKVTATGKLSHETIALNHLMRKKTKSRRRRMLKGSMLSTTQAPRIKLMMGQGH